MSTIDHRSKKRIAQKQLSVDPLYVGTDDDGAAHYWGYYDYAIIVVDDDMTADRFELTETPCVTPAQWCDYVEDKRGWTDGPNIGGSLVADLAEGME